MSSFFLSFDPISRLIKSFPEVSFFFLEIYVQKVFVPEPSMSQLFFLFKKKILKILRNQKSVPINMISTPIST